MAKRFFVVLLAGLLLLSGCNTDGNGQDAESPSASPDDSISPAAVSAGMESKAETSPEGGALLLLPGLIGKDDAAVTETLGDGTVRFGTDGKTIEAREYDMEVLQVTLEISAIYQEGVISHFDVFIPGLGIETWKNAMIQWFGDPVETEEKNKEVSSVKFVFEKENVRIVLMEAFDALSILMESK